MKRLNGTRTIFNSDSKINKTLRILLVSPLPCSTSFGGIGIWTSRFADILKKKENLKLKIVDSVPVDSNGKDIARTKNILKKIICNIRIFKKIKKEINTFKPDVIHLNSSCTPFACIRDYWFLKTITRKRIPCILHCRCNVKDQLNNNKVGLFFFKKNIHLASAILVLNNFSYQFINNIKNKNLKCFILPNFIQKNNVVATKTINKHVKNVCFVGHLVRQKGIEEIILLANEFTNLRFTLVCGYTEQYPKKSLFPKNVEITGNVSIDNVFWILDNSDVFLFPTYSEGFSNALLEAMARGLPIITTNVGANSDMLENRGGIIVDSNSNEDLKKAMRIIGDESIRKEMSMWNINKVKNSYTEDAFMNKILNIYFDILET